MHGNVSELSNTLPTNFGNGGCWNILRLSKPGVSGIKLVENYLVGDIVLVTDDYALRGCRSLGRVSKTFPDKMDWLETLR